MNGYGSTPIRFWNDAGERFWVKFHFKTQQGHKHLTNAEAEKVIGKTRESYQEQLYGAIERRATSRTGPCRSRSCPSSTPRRRPTTRST